MLKYSHIDKSKLPIVVVEFADFEPTEAQFNAHLSSMYDLYEQHHNIVVLFDSTNAVYLPARERALYGSWVKENSQLINNNVIAVGYITPAFTQRSIMKGILMAHPPKWTNKVFKLKENALLWAIEQLNS